MTVEKQSAPIKRGGKRPGAGRPKGSHNKTTTALKEAILLAAEKTGQDGSGKGGLTGYLSRAALDTPGPFLALLGKVLPLQVAGPDGEKLSIAVTFEQPKATDG